MLTENKKAFIEFMMSADVLRFGSFVTKSGRSTPYFVNTGNYKTGEQIAKLGKFYAALVKETVGEDFTAMFGPAYKGIPLVTATAAALYNEYGISKPYFFNRKEEKDHGEGGSLVGYKPTDDDRIIIIEDVITAGTAVRETMPILYGCGDVRVDDMFISVNRCEIGKVPGKTAIMEVKEEYGLNVLKANVQDQDNNYTRFICISKNLEVYPGADRTSLMMTLPHKPGSLYNVLSKFYALGINLRKLESRPLPDREFEFMFYFDLECSVYAPEMEKLFRDLECESEHLRYLGTYNEAIC